MLKKLFATLTVLLGVFVFPAFAQFDSSGGLNLGQTTFLKVEEAYRADPQWKAGELSIIWHAQPGYYLYEHQFKHELNGDILNVNFPANSQRKFDEFFNRELTVYYDNAYISVERAEPQIGDLLRTSFQGCADAGLCYPPETWYFEYLGNGQFTPATAPMELSSSTIPVPIANFSWFMVFSALLGGLILNAMPCVFPVLALKATSFINAGESARQHAWIYTAGVVSSFLIFAAIIISLAMAGQQVGWGFHLQSPVMVGVLIYLFVAMALVLALDMPIAQRIMGTGSSLQQGSSHSASFFTGLLAVVVASPCTAPFMGAAMGAALTQSASATLAIFAAIGLGMASPILVLSYWPALIKRLPKPGMWMVRVREFMVFPLLATALYLMWVLGQQTGVNGLTLVALGTLLLAMALWLFNMASKIAKVSAVLLLLLSFVFLQPPSVQESKWINYSDQSLASAQAEGPVFVDVTAAWCITCLANKRVLDSKATQALFEEYDVTLIEADWTSADEQISRYLSSYRRAGVPLYVYYPNGAGSGIVLPQLLTEQIVRATISAQN